MESSKNRKAFKLIAFAVGVIIAIVALSGWRLADTNGRFGADISFKAIPSGHLSTSAGAAFLTQTGLRPGAPLSAPGLVAVTNIGRANHGFRIRAVPSTPALNDLLAVQVTVAGQPLYSGTLGGLTEWSGGIFTLAQGQREPLELQAWLPATSARGFDGQIVEVDLQFKRDDSGPVG